MTNTEEMNPSAVDWEAQLREGGVPQSTLDLIKEEGLPHVQHLIPSYYTQSLALLHFTTLVMGVENVETIEDEWEIERGSLQAILRRLPNLMKELKDHMVAFSKINLPE